jgi:hypothetical protein
VFRPLTYWSLVVALVAVAAAQVVVAQVVTWRHLTTQCHQVRRTALWLVRVAQVHRLRLKTVVQTELHLVSR